mgnify:FL=1|tara:strand:+ start:419 stop:835 length:417 start_codon:yes stop_codon:yes gene_type:complete
MTTNLLSLDQLHLISTSMMVAIIWIVQILHYPTFLFIDKERYTEFQQFHMNKISYIIVPLMVVELISGLSILFTIENIQFSFYVSLSLLILIWLITGLFFTKFHSELSKKFSHNTILRLIRLNWIRTVFWTIRLALLL